MDLVPSMDTPRTVLPLMQGKQCTLGNPPARLRLLKRRKTATNYLHARFRVRLPFWKRRITMSRVPLLVTYAYRRVAKALHLLALHLLK